MTQYFMQYDYNFHRELSDFKYSPAKYLIALIAPLLYLYLFGISAWWRYFAHLPGSIIELPIYISEIVLFLLLLSVGLDVLGKRKLGRLWPEGQPLVRTIFLIIALLQVVTAARLFENLATYGLQAARDSVIVVYLLFIPLTFYLAPVISLRLCLLSIFCGLCAATVSWYLVNYIGGFNVDFLMPIPNSSILILPVIAVLVSFTSWRQVSIAVCVLLPTAMFFLMFGKRTFLLGSFLTIAFVVSLHFHRARNLPRLATAFALSFIFAIGLYDMPRVIEPAFKDVSGLLNSAYTKVDQKLRSDKFWEDLNKLRSDFSSTDTQDISEIASVLPETEGLIKSPVTTNKGFIESKSAEPQQNAVNKGAQTSSPNSKESTPQKAPQAISENVLRESTNASNDDLNRPVELDTSVVIPEKMQPKKPAQMIDKPAPDIAPQAHRAKPEKPPAPQACMNFRLLHGEDTGAGGLMSWRLFLWRNTINDIAEKPWIGWGFGPWVVKSDPSGPLTPETFISGPHNAYLTLAFRLGLPLTFVFLLIPALSLFYLLTKRKKIQLLHITAAGTIFYSYFSALFNIGFESPQDSVPVYILIGLLLYLLGKFDPWPHHRTT
jgi:hypothetical protein